MSLQPFSQPSTVKRQLLSALDGKAFMWFIQSAHKHLSSNCYVLSTIPGAEDITVNGTLKSLPCGSYILGRGGQERIEQGLACRRCSADTCRVFPREGNTRTPEGEAWGAGRGPGARGMWGCVGGSILEDGQGRSLGDREGQGSLACCGPAKSRT